MIFLDSRTVCLLVRLQVAVGQGTESLFPDVAVNAGEARGLGCTTERAGAAARVVREAARVGRGAPAQARTEQFRCTHGAPGPSRQQGEQEPPSFVSFLPFPAGLIVDVCSAGRGGGQRTRWSRWVTTISLATVATCNARFTDNASQRPSASELTCRPCSSAWVRERPQSNLPLKRASESHDKCSSTWLNKWVTQLLAQHHG
jgi:hypothetical protein